MGAGPGLVGWVRVAGWLVGCLIGVVADAPAQLISPGKLSTSHDELDGITKCTTCHQLRTRGIASAKCLDCHLPIRDRLSRDRGFHATVARDDCASCHKEHFGRDFEGIRFDTVAFDHRDVDFPLRERHADLACRECHTPDLVTAPDVREFKGRAGALGRTFMGLGTECVSCHASDDPHREQFADRGCTECHTEAAWSPAERYEHDMARYRLTGAHRTVACASCHRARGAGNRRYTRYRPLEFARCLSCHVDEHRGEMGSRCTGCHNTGSWYRISSSFETRFDHATTDFPLVGQHAHVTCDACHGKPPANTDELQITFVGRTRGRSYPVPNAANCMSCHRDYHEGVFRETPGAVCDGCHSQNAWYPSQYDIERHNQAGEFSLTGAHVAVPCVGCHADPAVDQTSLVFRDIATECASCHADDDPHQGQFDAERCTACHDTESFTVAGFDHAQTRFPLDGAHQPLSCASCHAMEATSADKPFRRYKPLGTRCRDCHVDP